MNITAQIDAWLPDHKYDRFDLNGNPVSVVDTLSYTNMDMSDVWLKIGRATITVDLCIDAKGIDAAKVAQLQDQLRDLSAKYEAGRTEILRRISQLTALPNEVKP